MDQKDPLKNWVKTTLWFKIGVQSQVPALELDVWHPRYCSDREWVRLLAKHASQGVDVLRKLVGTKEIIVQGQYGDRNCSTKKLSSNSHASET